MQKLTAAEGAVQMHPNRHPAVGSAPGCFVREVTIQRFEHCIASQTVGLLDALDVFRQQAAFCEFVNCSLRQQARMQVTALLHAIEMFYDHFRGSYPSYSQAGKTNLRKAADVDNQAVFIERLEWWNLGAASPKPSINFTFANPNPIPPPHA